MEKLNVIDSSMELEPIAMDADSLFGCDKKSINLDETSNSGYESMHRFTARTRVEDSMDNLSAQFSSDK